MESGSHDLPLASSFIYVCVTHTWVQTTHTDFLYYFHTIIDTYVSLLPPEQFAYACKLTFYAQQSKSHLSRLSILESSI